jgi:superoxide dismutase, Cu-Zn family
LGVLVSEIINAMDRFEPRRSIRQNRISAVLVIPMLKENNRMRYVIPALFVPAIVSCTPIESSQKPYPTPSATANLQTASGASVGTAMLVQGKDGVQLSVKVSLLTTGNFGMHLHSVGKCDAPDFVSAGPHLNPDGKLHGRENPMGSHMGDLPNIDSVTGEASEMEMALPGVNLSGIIDADGAALVIHERADDYKTDPGGNSGKRIICGVFKPS